MFFWLKEVDWGLGVRGEEREGWREGRERRKEQTRRERERENKKRVKLIASRPSLKKAAVIYAAYSSSV